MSKMSILEIYSEPKTYSLPHKGITPNDREAALAVVNPQINFLSPQGIDQEVFRDNTVENNAVEDLGTLLKVAREVQVPVFVSPHYYFPYDREWQSIAPGEAFIHGTGMLNRKGPLTMENFENSNAGFLPQFKPYVYDGEAVIASPHKTFGPETNGLMLRLRGYDVLQITPVGMTANLYIKSHMRELIRQGFKVVVVKDVTAGLRIPEDDGYLAVLTNYHIITNNLRDADTMVEEVKAAVK